MDAALGATGTRAAGYERIMASLGEPGGANALATKATRLETALLSAVSTPQSGAKLTEAVSAAEGLADKINATAAENVRIRSEADAEIARQVSQVNSTLHTVSDVNHKILTLSQKGVDTSGLQDERNRLIDSISSIIPLRAVKRENDQIALYAQNGGALLDGRVWELKFQPAPNGVTSDMTLGAPLSGLSQDQGAPTGPTAIEAGTGRGLMDGGSLEALFDLRDRIVPEFDGELDRYAEELISRFRDLVPAGARDANGDGLFVENNPGGLNGLAGRLRINASVDTQSGGAVFRLRDGLGATAPGPEGFGSYLAALSDAMVTSRQPAGFVSQTAANGGAGMAAEISSFFAGKSARSEDDRAYLTARQQVIAEREMSATGVDTDSELQSLLLVEQTYAANARVLSVIDGLMKLLLES